MSSINISFQDTYVPTFPFQTDNIGEKVDLKNEELTKSRLTGYIVRFIQKCTFKKYRDERLWEEFVDDFEGWTKDIFEIPVREAIKDLRDYLRENGVFVYKAPRIPMSGELAKTASEKEPHKWSDKEIEDILEKDERFNSRHHPDYVSTRASVKNLGSPLQNRLSLQNLSPSAQLRQNKVLESQKVIQGRSDLSESKEKIQSMSQIYNNTYPYVYENTMSHPQFDTGNNVVESNVKDLEPTISD
ncbi:hypothetical protein EPUL_001280, partial [Erysiphe pulchra]